MFYFVWRFKYAPGTLPPRFKPSYDAAAMVRSCLRWDWRAQEYVRRVSDFCQNKWLNTFQTGVAAGRTAYDLMAEFHWKFEEHVNSIAKDLWKQGSRVHAVPFSQEAQRWLK